MANPDCRRVVESGPVHDIVITGEDLKGPGKGLESLPIPISTPGFDAAPYLTMTSVITRDPVSGIQNMGTYRGHLKSPTRLGMMMLVNMRAGGLEHWKKFSAKNEPMPIAIVLGCPPMVAFQGPQKLRIDVDEYTVAGGLAGAPINVVKGKTVDLLVPAEAEVVVEGLVDPKYLEPEGPFGESHGYVALEDYNLVVEVTAITRRKDAILTSIISQVTPSESSVVKRLAYEPLFLAHLRDTLGIKGIKRVVLHEPLTNLRRFVFLQFAQRAAHRSLARSVRNPDPAGGGGKIRHRRQRRHRSGQCGFGILGDVLSLQSGRGHACGAVPRSRPWPAHGGSAQARIRASHRRDDETSDAALGASQEGVHGKRQGAVGKARPAALEAGNAVVRLFLGDWSEEWDMNAQRATEGKWMERSESYRQRRRTGVQPNTPARTVEGRDDG